MIFNSIKLIRTFIGGVLCDLGIALDRTGAEFGYRHEHVRSFSKHKTLFPLSTIAPEIDFTSKIAQQSNIIGSVKINENVYIGSGATLKGDSNPVRIGKNTIVSDYSVLVSKKTDNQILGSVNIGENVFIGLKSIIKNSVIDDGCYIGEGSIIGEGSLLEKNVIIMPNSWVPAGSFIKSNTVWSGLSIQKEEKASEDLKNKINKKIDESRNIYKELENKNYYINL